MSSTNGAKRTALNILCVVLALILTVMVGATIYVESMFNRMGTLNHETLSSSEAEEILKQTEGTLDPEFTGPTLNPDDVTIPTEPAEVIVTGENIINIVLVGQDRREGQGRQRSDSMILCTINKEKKTITMTSFLRDIYVSIPGYYRQRLNVAYLLGGYKTLNATLEHNFGVSADHCVEVDFSGFENIINVLGGVDVELTEAEAKYLNRRGNWDVQEGPVDWTLKEGVNTLTGAQALAYSRIRALDNDWGRSNRQRTVLSALLAKAKTMSLTQLNEFANQILPMIATDMTPSEITGYLMELFPLLGDLNIKTQTIPANGTWQYATIDGNAVIAVNFEKNQKILRELFEE
jgi:LCP family protein required for cell wall assembly